MKFDEVDEKGIAKCLVEAGIDRRKLRIHISRVEGGGSSHPPHIHSGLEAFYMIKGRALVEAEGEKVELGPNEALVLDAAKPHCISNAAPEPMEYMVIASE